MCTVTFIVQNNKVLIASNRDERACRKAALPPKEYKRRTGTIYFPQDGEAGGTWIAMHENGNAMVLLNGAIEKHITGHHYRRSRGLIFLDVFDTKNPLVAFTEIDLNDIEPFTLVLWQYKKLFECTWDGANKFHNELDAACAGVWSSVTLYHEEVIARRKKWFEDWLKDNPDATLDDLMHFHQFTGDGDIENDLLMNRNNELSTVSITGFEIREDQAIVEYIDFKSHQTFDSKFALSQTVTV